MVSPFFTIENANPFVKSLTCEPSCLEGEPKFMMLFKEEELEEVIEEEFKEEEEEDDLEYFNTTREELEYHEYLLKNPRPFWIRAKGLESRKKPSNPNKTCNFDGRVRGLKVFVEVHIMKKLRQYTIFCPENKLDFQAEKEAYVLAFNWLLEMKLSTIYQDASSKTKEQRSSQTSYTILSVSGSEVDCDPELSSDGNWKAHYRFMAKIQDWSLTRSFTVPTVQPLERKNNDENNVFANEDNILE
ncbi:hypothetical protein Tco_1092765 [Tanacetum coccineum]|uniref:Uncharacterized protein n=1 Tax=Tanacetum coccineum TaxID=301880 RepID=A0ABQ5IAS3_9ASTR